MALAYLVVEEELSRQADMLRVILRFRIISSSFMEPTLAICRWAYVSATTVVVMTTKHQFLQVPHTLASDMHASVKRIYRALAPSRNSVVILNNENVSFVIVDIVNHDISRLHALYEPSPIYSLVLSTQLLHCAELFSTGMSIS